MSWETLLAGAGADILKYLSEIISKIAGLAKSFGATAEDLEKIVREAEAMPPKIDKEEAEAIAEENKIADTSAGHSQR